MNTKYGTIHNMGPNIKSKLKEKGKTYEELSLEWGITKAAVCNLLSGRRKIDTEKALVAADFLGCTVYDLIQPAIGKFDGGESFEECNT